MPGPEHRPQPDELIPDWTREPRSDDLMSPLALWCVRGSTILDAVDPARVRELLTLIRLLASYARP